MKKSKYTYIIYLIIYLLLASFAAGCANDIDYVVGPINSKLEELNDRIEKIDLPVEAVPDTKFHFKSRKLMIEKRF